MTGSKGWHVVDGKRGGRSCAQLCSQLDRLLDDLYQVCELESNDKQVMTVVRLLRDGLQDFNDLAIQLAALSHGARKKAPVSWQLRPHRMGSRSPRLGPIRQSNDSDESQDQSAGLQDASGPTPAAATAAATAAAAAAVSGLLAGGRLSHVSAPVPRPDALSHSDGDSGLQRPPAAPAAARQHSNGPAAKQLAAPQSQPDTNTATASSTNYRRAVTEGGKVSSTAQPQPQPGSGPGSQGDRAPATGSVGDRGTWSSRLVSASSAMSTSSSTATLTSHRSLPDSDTQLATRSSAGAAAATASKQGQPSAGATQRRTSQPQPASRGAASHASNAASLGRWASVVAGHGGATATRLATAMSLPVPSSATQTAGASVGGVVSDRPVSAREHGSLSAEVGSQGQPVGAGVGGFQTPPALQLPDGPDGPAPCDSASEGASAPPSAATAGTAATTPRDPADAAGPSGWVREGGTGPSGSYDAQSTPQGAARPKANRRSALTSKPMDDDERVEAILQRSATKDARSKQLRQAHLAAVVQKAGDEARKVAEVAFINRHLEEEKKLCLQQKLEDGEARRREILEERMSRGKSTAVEQAAERRRAAEDARQDELAQKAKRKEAAQKAWADKVDQERREQAAARQAAREAQLQLAKEQALAAQREAAERSARIEARLKEAAQRRAARLETLTQRAALGAIAGVTIMDASTATNTGTGASTAATGTPGVAGASGTGPTVGTGLASPPRSPQQASAQRGGSGAARRAAPPAAGTRGALGSPTSNASASQSATAAPLQSQSQSQSNLSRLSLNGAQTGEGAVSAAQLSPVQIKTGAGSVTGSSNPRNRLKGMRRRAAKLLTRIQADSFVPTPPVDWQDALATPQGQALLARWTALVPPTNRPTVSSTGGSSTDDINNDANIPEAPMQGHRDRNGGVGTSDGVGVGASSGGGSGGGEGGLRTRVSVGNGSAGCSMHVPIAAAAADLAQRALRTACLAAALPSGMLAWLCQVVGDKCGARLPVWDPAASAARLLLELVQAPANAQAVLAGGHAVSLVKGVMRALDRANSSDMVLDTALDASAAHTTELACLTQVMEVLTRVVQLQPPPTTTLSHTQPHTQVPTHAQPSSGAASSGQAAAPRHDNTTAHDNKTASTMQSDRAPVCNKCMASETNEVDTDLAGTTPSAASILGSSLPANQRDSEPSDNNSATQDVRKTDTAQTSGQSVNSSDQTSSVLYVSSGGGGVLLLSEWQRAAAMREHFVGYMTASGIVHRLSELFILCDQPQLWRGDSGVAAMAAELAAQSQPAPAPSLQPAADAAADTHAPSTPLPKQDSTPQLNPDPACSATDSAATTAAAPSSVPTEPSSTATDRGVSDVAGAGSADQGVCTAEEPVCVGGQAQRGPSTPTGTGVGVASAASGLPPIPAPVVKGLHLLQALTDRPSLPGHQRYTLTSDKRWHPTTDNAASLSLAFQETGMAGLPMLLTAVLLHAAPSCTPVEARHEALPVNFGEAALAVVRCLNNVARLDLPALQTGLVSNSLYVGVSHLLGFLISYATNAWPTDLTEGLIKAAFDMAQTTGVQDSTDNNAQCISGKGNVSSDGCGQSADRRGGSSSDAPTVGSSRETVALLNEVLVLVGFFTLLNAKNQGVLMWGRPPDCVLHRLSAVPNAYLTRPDLAHILLGTLLSASYENPRLRSLVETWLPHCSAVAKIGKEHLAKEPDASTVARLPEAYLLEQRLPKDLLHKMLDALCGGAAA